MNLNAYEKCVFVILCYFTMLIHYLKHCTFLFNRKMPINQGKQDNEDFSKKCIRSYFVTNIES